MAGAKQLLELTWFNKDKALIPSEEGKYAYEWVDPKDPRYCETRTLVIDEVVTGAQSPKAEGTQYSERADLEPTDDNLLILGESGDVLEALTRVPELREKYLGKVKCIYIDPPFNTAQTFANYEDNLEHSVWLTMMRDRLIHLRKLLSAEGSIWVHLDDVENHRMRVLMDEIFGNVNFIAEVVWQKADSGRNDVQGFSSDHDVIIVYGKTPGVELNRMERTDADNDRFTNPDSDKRGAWFSSDRTAPGSSTHPGMVYGVEHPLTGELFYPAVGRHWSLGKDRMLPALGEYAYYIEQDPDLTEKKRRTQLPDELLSTDVKNLIIDPSRRNESKRRTHERMKAGNWPEFFITEKSFGRKSYPPSYGQPPRTWWDNFSVGHNRAAKSEIKALFPGQNPFSTPKPERLLERIIHIATSPGDVVLDVFAGSGTTAAVAQKMGRRWVTCELVEDTFARFTRPRLEKVINGEDQGGITIQKAERVDATDDGLPEGVTPEDAQKFNSVLNKVLAANSDLKTEAVVKALKTATKTKNAKGVVNWRGGGGFTVAHLSPQCFDYSPELNLVTLTEAATGPTLVNSVAANLNFALTPNNRHFDGKRGSMFLKVVEGRLDREKVEELLTHLGEGEGATLAATELEPGVRQFARTTDKPCQIVHIPNGIFSYSGTQEGK